MFITSPNSVLRGDAILKSNEGAAGDGFDVGGAGDGFGRVRIGFDPGADGSSCRNKYFGKAIRVFVFTTCIFIFILS